MKTEIDHIHYVNNLWHLSHEFGDKRTTIFLKNRKTKLQNKLMAKYIHAINLVFDNDETQKVGFPIYSIQFKEIKGDACHIPVNDIDQDIATILIQEDYSNAK
jgi:hypothetical protein